MPSLYAVFAGLILSVFHAEAGFTDAAISSQNIAEITKRAEQEKGLGGIQDFLNTIKKTNKTKLNMALGDFKAGQPSG
eukprot:CAMPEP_0197662866 /NCGR_PEP_ID=MMETSP1338-20131121/55181_1 /TAXON_ID=43686 ORGANISM="Pelagodinium beii, Strain RCC1491" /NCGR_SAMPLE_ID=MMETSP1338 /ASSEMBLY_ACC=CAM_ASM_000754 /LENGTH=77 /DNA_ID=CAMNT_0043240941 /DNA_START=57 /DNA_END=287 /DNA_ORIENTATION=+